MASRFDGARLLRIDAVFELVTSLAIWLIAITSLTGLFLWPAPVTVSLLYLGGAILIVVAALLWASARRANPTLLRTVAALNGASAAAVAAWLILNPRGFSLATVCFLALVMSALAILAILQSRSARRT